MHRGDINGIVCASGSGPVSVHAERIEWHAQRIWICRIHGHDGCRLRDIDHEYDQIVWSPHPCIKECVARYIVHQGDWRQIIHW